MPKDWHEHRFNQPTFQQLPAIDSRQRASEHGPDDQQDQQQFERHRLAVGRAATGQRPAFALRPIDEHAPAIATIQPQRVPNGHQANRRESTAAAQTATSEGNTTAAAPTHPARQRLQHRLDERPTPQRTGFGAGGRRGHHHHHHAHAVSNDSDASSSANASTAGSASSAGASQMLSQLLAVFQANESQTDALDPMSIINNTLTQAGITGSTADAGRIGHARM